jgi:Skp family chaperone for outer membrane proteins
MRIMKVILVLALCMPLFAQNPVTEAKDRVAKEHHEALVQKAKQRLEHKAQLEAELKQVDEELQALESGRDVKEPPPNFTINCGTTTCWNGCTTFVTTPAR